jgi:hypothetical protein
LIRGVSTRPGQVAKIDLDGYVINERSPVEIRGETDIFAFDHHTDVRMAFRNIELPIFNPYSGRFAGYAIAKGKLTTELHYTITDRALVADHHVILDQLEWGEATDSKDKVGLPVRLATSLLKDRNGVIDLSLPVQGTLDDPKFRIGPIVWQVVVNVLTKAVTAPFALLGSLFEGAQDAQFVDFEPGSSALGEQSRNGLAALARGLAEKRELRLDVPAGVASADIDADAIGRAHLRAALAQVSGKSDPDFDPDALEPGRRLDLLEDLYRERMGHRASLPDPPAAPEDADRAQKRELRDNAAIDWLQAQLAPLYAATPDELQALAQARAAAVQDALLADGAIDPARVFVATNLSVAPHEGKARMELKLE